MWDSQQAHFLLSVGQCIISVLLQLTATEHVFIIVMQGLELNRPSFGMRIHFGVRRWLVMDLIQT